MQTASLNGIGVRNGAILNTRGWSWFWILCSQPAGDLNHKADSKLSLLSAKFAVIF